MGKRGPGRGDRGGRDRRDRLAAGPARRGCSAPGASGRRPDTPARPHRARADGAGCRSGTRPAIGHQAPPPRARAASNGAPPARAASPSPHEPPRGLGSSLRDPGSKPGLRPGSGLLNAAAARRVPDRALAVTLNQIRGPEAKARPLIGAQAPVEALGGRDDVDPHPSRSGESLPKQPPGQSAPAPRFSDEQC
jgi:hypothetical protein